MVVFQNTHQLALIRVKFKLARLVDGAVYINKVAEIIAERSRIGAFATNHLAHLALQVDGVNLAVDGRVLCGLEIHLLAIEAIDFRHIPRAIGKLLHQSAIHFIKVNVIVAASFRSHQEGLAALKEVPIVGNVDVIIVGLIVENAALARGGIGSEDFEVVLMAVEALNGQHIGILRPCNARQINIGFLACIHLHGLAAFEVVNVNLNDGVVFARLGILEAVPIGIKALKLFHLELTHVAFVELHIGDFLAVR